MLSKPCPGEFSDEVKLLLERNRDRAQWSAHECKVCGKLIDAELKAGVWVPAQHWPSVRYVARGGEDSARRPRYSRTA